MIIPRACGRKAPHFVAGSIHLGHFHPRQLAVGRVHLQALRVLQGLVNWRFGLHPHSSFRRPIFRHRRSAEEVSLAQWKESHANHHRHSYLDMDSSGRHGSPSNQGVAHKSMQTADFPTISINAYSVTDNGRQQQLDVQDLLSVSGGLGAELPENHRDVQILLLLCNSAVYHWHILCSDSEAFNPQREPCAGRDPGGSTAGN